MFACFTEFDKDLQHDAGTLPMESVTLRLHGDHRKKPLAVKSFSIHPIR